MTEDTPLYRQVHPAWIQQGRVTSLVFRPMPKDRGRLSVYDGDQITAEGSWTHYTQVLGHPSDGVLAVLVGECLRELLDVEPDPEPFPEHAIIDFTALGRSQIESKAKRLREVALVRGWQHRADD